MGRRWEKIIFAYLFAVSLLSHDILSRSQSFPLALQVEKNELLDTANKTQTSNLRGENFAGSNLGGFRRCS